MSDRPPPKWHVALIPALLAIWAGLIFWTSCYVLRPHEFFGIVQRLTFLNDEAMDGFKGFWGAGGYLLFVKGWHVTEFAILTLLCAFAAKWISRRFDSWTVGASMVFCILFAISDEWHQTFVPDRFGTVTDVFIDVAGVALAGALLCWRLRVAKRRSSPLVEADTPASVEERDEVAVS